MKILRNSGRLSYTLIVLGVFLLCLGTGFISGKIFRDNERNSFAASSNITVADNNQVFTHDQGVSTITRSSTVTVKDASSSLGYTLSARVSQNTSGFVIKIGSAASTVCSIASPCTITSDTAPVVILDTVSTNATTAQGHTTDWTITITMPGNTPQGNYIVDIEYSETPKDPPYCPTLVGKTYLQDITVGTRSSHGVDRERVVLKDRRNNQDYYVQNIANNDGACTAWMETNLRYGGDGSWDAGWSYPDDRYATTTALAANTRTPYDDAKPLTMTPAGRYMGDTSSFAEAYAVAGVLDVYAQGQGTNILDTANPANNTQFYGYLYNWCAAMGGQTGDGTINANSGNACAEGPDDTSTFDTTISICPAGWRLPTGDRYGDFYNLNMEVNGGSTTTDQGLRDNWLGVWSGLAFSPIFDQGSRGYYRSSTAFDNDVASYILEFRPSLVYPGTIASGRELGFAVRCIL